jgi:hypothetical protein
MPFSEIIAGKLEQFAASLASIFAVLGIAGALLLGAWLIAKWLGRVGRPDLRAYDASPWGEFADSDSRSLRNQIIEGE